jgi:hypothetical protein
MVICTIYKRLPLASARFLTGPINSMVICTIYKRLPLASARFYAKPVKAATLANGHQKAWAILPGWVHQSMQWQETVTHLTAHVPHFLLQASIGFEDKLVYRGCPFAVIY